MKARIKEITFDAKGNKLLTITTREDILPLVVELQDQDITVDLRRYRKSRSLDANAYCWVLVDKIAEKVGTDKISVYREAIRNIAGNSDIVCVQNKALDALREGWEHNGLGWVTETFDSQIDGCTNVRLYYGSSVYDSAQMSALLHAICDTAKEYGIETATPAEMAAYEQRWRERYERKNKGNADPAES